MAIVQNPITGRSSGKMANVIFSKWKTKNTLRSKPLEVANPRTSGQVKTRTRFSYAVASARSILALIQLTFKELATSQSEFNAFIKENMPAVQLDLSGNVQVDVMALKLSKGSLSPIAGGTPGASTTTTVAATWTNNSNGVTAHADDTVRLIAFVDDSQTFIVSPTVKTRADASGVFTIPGINPSVDSFNAYLVVYNTATGKAGDSVQII